MGREILVDVSGWQESVVPWLEASKHPEQKLIGALIKFSQEDFESKAAFRHASGAKSAGIPITGYHYAVPQKPVRDDAQKEAQRFVQKIRDMAHQGTMIDLYPFLDLEEGAEADPETGAEKLTDEEMVEWVTIFTDYVCGALALDKMGIYANKRYIKHLVKGRGENLAKHLLWIAGDDAEVPPGIWSKASLWQTPERQLPYYPEKIDIDIAPDGICPLMIRNTSAAIAKCGPTKGGGLMGFVKRLSTTQKIGAAAGAVSLLGVGGWLLWKKLQTKKK